MLSCFLCQMEQDSSDKYLSHLREFHKLTDKSNCICNRCFINVPFQNYGQHIKTHVGNKRKRENEHNDQDFLLSLNSVKVEPEDYLDAGNSHCENESADESSQDNHLMDLLKIITGNDRNLIDCVYKLCKECKVQSHQLRDLKKHHLKILFPRLELGNFIQFEKLLIRWQENPNQVLNNTEVTPRITVVESLQNNNFTNNVAKISNHEVPATHTYKICDHTRTINRIIKCFPVKNDIILEANLNGIQGKIILVNKYGTIVENSELRFLSDTVLMIAPSPDDWTPEIKQEPNIPTSDDFNNLEEKRLWLKQYMDSVCEMDTIEKYFKDTFLYQRNYLNNILEPPTIEDINDKWPILLKPRFLKLHYVLLFKNELNLKKTISENNLKLNEILQKSNRVRSRKIINTEREFIEGIFEYFNELHQIYKEYDIGTSVEQYNPSQDSPWMACQRISQKQYKFIVFLSGHHICTTSTFVDGFTLLLYCFLIFNIEYPSVGACSLEFLRMLSGSYTSFAHSQKHFTNSQKTKILSFIMKFKSY